MYAVYLHRNIFFKYSIHYLFLLVTIGLEVVAAVWLKVA